MTKHRDDGAAPSEGDEAMGRAADLVPLNQQDIGLPAVWQQPPPRLEQDEEDVISLDKVLQTLRRRKWLLVSVAATVVVLTLLHVFTATPMYRAVVVLQVDPEEAKILPFEQMGTEVGSGLASEEYLWTQAEKLRSGALAKAVIERLDLADAPAFVEPVREGALIDGLRLIPRAVGAIFGGSSPLLDYRDPRRLQEIFLDRLEVTPIRNTRLIEVSFEAPDPELAAEVANATPEAFIEQHLMGRFNASTTATDFLRGQLQDLKVAVERSEEELLEYAERKNIVNQGDAETTARKRLADLSDELTLVQASMIEKQAQAEAAAATSLARFPETLENETIVRLETRRSEIEQELSGLAERYGPQWPQVKELRLQLGDIESQLVREKRRVLDTAGQDHELTRDRYEKLSSAVDAQRALVDRLNQDSIQYNILLREVDSNKELYEGLLQRLKEESVAAGLRSSNIQVADGAEPPRFAASPRKGRLLGLGAILGLLLGVGAALMAEAIDNTLKTPEDVTQYLGLPGLGMVPRLVLADADSHRWIGGGRKGTEKAELQKPILEDEVASEERAAAREAYRTLRTSLMLSHSDRPPQIVLVTSALPEEGKTTTAANLAIALAATGERTLLIDADLRQPALAKAFGLSFEQGLTNCLSGTSTLALQIRELDRADLFLVPAGLVAPNPPELLGSRRMHQALEIVREYFTYVVIDAPPTLGLADSRVLAREVDGIMLVARAGKTPRGAVARSAQQLRAVGGRILGVVLNHADVAEGEYGYGYGYGRYKQGGYLEPPKEAWHAKERA